MTTPGTTAVAGAVVEAAAHVPGSAPEGVRTGDRRAEVGLTTLTRRGDFLAAARARRAALPGFVLQARKRPAEPDGLSAMRVGFTCSKKVGNAVARNRAKRRLRALARSVLAARGRPGWDYVLIGREGVTATRDFARMHAELASALDRIHGDAREGG